MKTNDKTLAVDVLAVMADNAQKAKRHRMTVDAEYADDAEEESEAARAALVELIEEAATVCQQNDPLDRHIRLRAALARVKGEAA